MQILRTDWQGRGKWRKLTQWMNSIGRLFNDMVGENGITVEHRGGRLVVSADIPPGGVSFPWNRVDFHPRKTAENAITINAGWVMVGGQVPVLVAPATRTITIEHAFIWLSYDFSSNTATISTPSNSLPTPSDNQYIHPLVLTSYDEETETCAIVRYIWLGGAIHLPGTYGR